MTMPLLMVDTVAGQSFRVPGSFQLFSGPHHSEQLTPEPQTLNPLPNRSVQWLACHATAATVPRERLPALNAPLRALQPITLIGADRGNEALLWQTLLSQYHYLGFSTQVGQSIRYLAQTSDGRPVACLLFGAAAWKTAPRDAFIGWGATQRERNLSRVVNNMRFLIPPWVHVPHLASHVLAMALHRLPDDWQIKYGFKPVLVETFVEQERFKGTCYKAANWQCVGATTGRTRQDRYAQIKVPIKDIYLYPLCREFKKTLCAEES